MIKKTMTLGQLRLSHTGIPTLKSFPYSTEAWTSLFPKESDRRDLLFLNETVTESKLEAKEKRKKKKKKSFSHTLPPSSHPRAEFLVSFSPKCASHSLGVWGVGVSLRLWRILWKAKFIGLQGKLMKHQYCSCPYFSKCPEHFFL